MARFMIFDSAAILDNEGNIIGDHPLKTATYSDPPINFDLSGGGSLWSASPPAAFETSYVTSGGKYLVQRYTKPVKVSGALDGDIEKVSVEFMIDLFAPFEGGLKTYLQWWIEFWADGGSFIEARQALDYDGATVYGLKQPFTRKDPTLSVSYKWSREQTVEIAGGGVLQHFPVTRRIADIGYSSESPDGGTTKPTGATDARFFPLRMHSGYMRIGMLLTSDYSQVGSGATYPATPSEAFTNISRVRAWAVVGGMDQQAALALMNKPIAGFYP